MMTPTENRNTVTSPASTSERRRARAKAGGGFVRRTRALAGVALVCALALGAEGDVATDNNTLANGASARAQVAREDAGAGFLYSRWIATERPLISLPPGKGSRVGNSKQSAEHSLYELTPLPQPLPGGKGEGGFWGDVAGKVRERAVERLRGSLLGVLPKPEELRAILIKYGNGEEFDMAQWREIRRRQLKAAVENAPLAFYADTEQSLARAISQTAVDRLGFVRRARVDFRTSLGDRQASGGVDAAGALRESADEVIGWQLRAFAGEGGNKGGNIGAFWRRAQWLHFVDEGLLGANIFADYEDTDDGSFWRWSIGGEMKTRLGDVNVNRYFVLTDPVVLANNRRVYSRAGLDIDAALNIPGAEWAQARVGYFLWEGEFGDADIEGFKAGFDIKPGAGIVVGVEFDGESGDIGGNFAYTHNIGEPFASAQGAGVFDPRAHFFDAVRREYSQRIVNTGAGDGANFAVIVTTGLNFAVRGELPGTATVSTLNITAASFTTGVNDEFAITGNVTVETNTTPANGMAVFRQKGGNWHLTLNANSEVAFTNTAHLLVINRGSGEFERVNPPRPAGVVVAGAVLSLIGTRFRFGVPPQVSPQNKASITLVEGGMMADMAAMDRVTIKVGERASVMVMMGGSMVVVGCGAGQTANAGGVGAICIGGGGVDLEPVSTPDNVSVEGGRVLVPFGATMIVGRYSLSMVNADITLMASVETPGFSLAMSTAGSGDGRYFAFDLVIEESAATVAGVKNPRVSVTDPAFAVTRLVVFTVQVARKLQVNVNPAQVEVTQNITAANIAVVNAGEGTRDYLYSVITHDTLFDLDGNTVNNNAQINDTAALTVKLEATDALGDKATVDLTVNVAPTPALALTPLGLLVVGTSDIAVAAGGILAAGGATPLRYDIAIGDNNFAETANIPNVGANPGGAATVNVTTGAIQIRGSNVGQTFDLYYRVQDSAPGAAQQTTLGTVLVSVSEGVALSGPILNATVTATTNGGSNTGMVLGTVVAQLRAGLQVRAFNLLGGHAVLRPADNNAERREVYYSGNTQTAVTAQLTIRVSDSSAGGEGNPPNSAEAVFYLAIVNPANVEAGLSGDAGLRYFTDNQRYDIVTATASGGAGGYQYHLTVNGARGNNNGANIGSDGVLYYRQSDRNNTALVTVIVMADDNHSGTDATAAATVTLSAIARLRAESISRPRITTGSTLSGANAIVVTVSVSGGENRAAFVYSRISEGTQLTGADINNSGVIFAADGTRIDAYTINGNRGGSRNFVYEVVDGAIEARRQTLTATAVIESVVPQPIAAGVSPIGNEVITVGADAAARLRITPSGGGGAYNFAQTNAANIMMAGAQADANNAAVFIVSINAPNAAGTASVSIVIDDEHFATAPYTVARRFIAINELAVDFAPGAEFTPQTTSLDITVGTVRAVGGLNPRVDRLLNLGGDSGDDLRLDNLNPNVASLRALVLRNSEQRNQTERTVTFEIAASDNANNRFTLTGAVSVVARLRLNGGGEYIVTVGSRDITIATIRAVGGERGDGYQFTDPSIAAPFAALEIDNANDLRVVKLGNTAIPASRNGQTDSLVFSVTDDATPQAAAYTTTLTARYVNPLAAANTYKDGGGVVTTAADLQVIGTITAGGGVGNFTFAEIGVSPLNVNAEGEINGTFNSPLTATIQVRVDDAGSGGEDVGATHPVTVEVAVTAFAPVTANVNQTITRYRKGVSVTLATLRSYSGGSGAAGLTASVLGFYQAASRATVIENEVVVWPDPAVTQRGTARITIVTYDSANDAAPQSTITFPLFVVDALRWTSPPTTPLTVTTQGVQSGSSFNNDDALPILLGVVGGNANNEHNLGSRTDGFNLGTQNQQFSYTGNGGRFAQEAQTVTVTVFGTDRNAADNYRQTTSLTITVAFIDPQEEITIGFAPGFDTSPLTAAGEITIGEVIVGGGLRAKDAVILGNGGNFSIADHDTADSGRARLILGGDNTVDRVTAVTLSGDDNHTRTNPALVTVTVNVVDRVKLRGAGARYTVLAQADNAVTPIFEFEPIGGMPHADDGYSVQTAIEPTDANIPAGFTRTGTRTVTIARNNVSIATGEHVFIQEVADTADTVRGTATIEVINELALSVGDNMGGDAFRGDVNLPGGFPFGQGFASGGAGDYTYRVEGPGIGGGRQDVRVGNDGVMVASHSSTHPAATITYTLIADDGADVTEPATVEFTLTVLQPVAAAPLPVILVTTKSTPGGAGASGPPQTVTTRVDFAYAIAANIAGGAFNGSLRSNASLVITAVPGQPVTVTRNIGSDLQGAGTRNAQVIHTDNETDYPLTRNDVQIPNVAGNTYTLHPYPALTGGGGGGGTVPAFTIDASGGHGPFKYYLSGAQTPGALADILYYTADSASNGIVYFNAGVQARAAAGDVAVAHNLQVRDSSAPTRNANVPGMLTISYVNPPPVVVAVNRTKQAYRTGVSVTIADLTYTGGTGNDNLTATILGLGGGGTAEIIGGDVIVSALSTGTLTATINAYDSTNDTAPNAEETVTIIFVEPLIITDLPAEPLTITTQDAQTDNTALPRTMTASGGNDGTYTYTAPAGYTYTNGELRYTGNNSNFPQAANTAAVEIIVTDTEANGYSQAATVTVTVAYINPPDLTIGFDGDINNAVLTTDQPVTIGTIVLGGGLSDLGLTLAADSHADFSLNALEANNNATVELILSGANNAPRTLSVTLTGDDNHTGTDAKMLSITVRINDALTLISAPPVITITAGKIDGFTGEENMTAELAQLMVQGNLSDDITVSIITAESALPAEVSAVLSLNGDAANWTVQIDSTSVQQTGIAGDYTLAFAVHDGEMSVATVAIPVSVVNAPVRADTAVTAITTYFYTGFTSEVTLTAIAFTNLYIPADENASITITVAPATDDNAAASEKYTAALSAITNAAGAVEIKYTRQTAANAPQTGDDFTLNATVIISNDGETSKNPFTATATLQWKIGGIPALSINFQSPPNTVFIRGYKGTIGVLTVSASTD